MVLVALKELGKKRKLVNTRKMMLIGPFCFLAIDTRIKCIYVYIMLYITIHFSSLHRNSTTTVEPDPGLVKFIVKTRIRSRSSLSPTRRFARCILYTRIKKPWIFFYRNQNCDHLIRLDKHLLEFIYMHTFIFCGSYTRYLLLYAPTYLCMVERLG